MNQKPKTLLVIDGSSMLSTSYFGNLPKSILFEKDEEKKKQHYNEILQTSDGRYTNGIFTMFRSLLSLLRSVQPDYCVFVFDRTRNTFRRTKLHADMYKANRKETPEPLKEQFAGMEKALKDIGFTVLSGEEYEADDYAASLLRKFEAPDLRTLVHTKDHDYEQLVNDYTRLLRVVDKNKAEELKSSYGLFTDSNGYDSMPSGTFEYTKDIVFAEEGVQPEQIPDLWAIVGDPSDGIPGCKGVSSAAAPLLRYYGDIEHIYEAIDALEGDAKAEKALATMWKNDLGISRSPLKALKEYRDDVFLSKQLATMVTDIPLDLAFEDMELPTDTEAYRKVFDEYELTSLVKDIDRKGIC